MGAPSGSFWSRSFRSITGSPVTSSPSRNSRSNRKKTSRAIAAAIAGVLDEVGRCATVFTVQVGGFRRQPGDVAGNRRVLGGPVVAAAGDDVDAPGFEPG